MTGLPSDADRNRVVGSLGGVALVLCRGIALPAPGAEAGEELSASGVLGPAPGPPTAVPASAEAALPELGVLAAVE